MRALDTYNACAAILASALGLLDSSVLEAPELSRALISSRSRAVKSDRARYTGSPEPARIDPLGPSLGGGASVAHKRPLGSPGTALLRPGHPGLPVGARAFNDRDPANAGSGAVVPFPGGVGTRPSARC